MSDQNEAPHATHHRARDQTVAHPTAEADADVVVQVETDVATADHRTVDLTADRPTADHPTAANHADVAQAHAHHQVATAKLHTVQDSTEKKFCKIQYESIRK